MTLCLTHTHSLSPFLSLSLSPVLVTLPSPPSSLCSPSHHGLHRAHDWQVLGILRCNWDEVTNMTGVSVTPVGTYVRAQYIILTTLLSLCGCSNITRIYVSISIFILIFHPISISVSVYIFPYLDIDFPAVPKSISSSISLSYYTIYIVIH